MTSFYLTLSIIVTPHFYNFADFRYLEIALARPPAI